MTSTDLSILTLTLRVASLATLLLLPVGVGIAWGLARWRGPGKGIAETVVTLPLVLPPTAVGLVLLSALKRSGPLGRMLENAGIDLLFTWKAIVLATAVMSLPLLVRPTRAAFEEVDPRLFAVARSLGDGRWRVFRRVALPLAWRGILAGTMLAFSRALGEFGATILVAGNIPGRTQTLSLAIFQRNQTGHDAEALRLVAVTVVLAFVIVWGTQAVEIHRQRRERGPA